MAADAQIRSALPRYGVAGWPVAHSLSPQMHRAAYAALGIDALYQRLPMPPDLFAETTSALPASGFRGINVTVPHKAAALALATDPSQAASAIGAANTLTFHGDQIHAENTDAPGLLAALGSEFRAKTALVAGAGGTARAAVWALTNAGVEVSIWNRTNARALQIAADFDAIATDDLRAGISDNAIFVNCTTIGMEVESGTSKPSSFADLPLAKSHTVVDFVYSAEPTDLVIRAHAAGCTTVDGRDLLAHQGSLSFAQWFNVEPPYAVMRGALDS